MNKGKGLRRTGFKKKSFADFRAQQDAKKKKCGEVRIKKKASIAIRSKKQNARLAKYYPIRRKFLEEHPICAVCWERFKKVEVSTEVHHVNGRAGDALFDTGGFVATCWSCGQWVHRFPVDAARRGFMPKAILIRAEAFEKLSRLGK